MAAAALFALGVSGLLVVMPYNPPSPLEPLVVTSPATHVSSYPTPDMDGWVSRGNENVSPAGDVEPASSGDETPAANETPEPEATQDTPVFAAGVLEGEIRELEPQPESTPEADESAIETPEATATETPTGTPEATATPDESDPGVPSGPQPASASD